MDDLHSIAFFYDSVVITSEYGPVQIIDEYGPPRHGRIRVMRMYTDRKCARIFYQVL